VTVDSVFYTVAILIMLFLSCALLGSELTSYPAEEFFELITISLKSIF